jgi:hypothetical protein
MRFTKSQVRDAQVRAVRRFRLGRLACFVLGLTLGVGVGWGLAYLTSTFRIERGGERANAIFPIRLQAISLP